ncbi:MAG TPA: hypothetical protein VMZ30_04790 [Pyrinomonadaceae bacterium]|nr:hypothetical protein [Pyrinomonadaceae bacterium]
MKRSRKLLLFGLFLCGAIAAWLWWMRPKNVDMAAYAPANSLLYLEANRPLEIFDEIASSEAWRVVTHALGTPAGDSKAHWLRGFMRWTGIGPIRTVILARSQVAVVVNELRTAEEGDTLKIKPEAALLIETHTAERRIRPVAEEALQRLAEKTYGHPSERRGMLDGVEFIEWVAPEGSRQMVGAILGSLVVVGTSEDVVQKCLSVARGRAAALNGDPELATMRARLQADRRLTFGYVPSGNSARLLAVAIPILLGRAPGDSEFQRLITKGATKVFGGIGWSSTRYMSGIEDRYLIDLQPSIVDRLKPTFVSVGVNSQMPVAMPNVYSVTTYRFVNPKATWQTLKTAVSSQVDALSTIVFSSILRSALLSYGIDEPEAFLGAVDGELLTIRLDENSERSILIARARDRPSLRQLFLRTMTPGPQPPGAESAEILEHVKQDLAVSLGEEIVVLGPTTDVRRYLELLAQGARKDSSALRRMTFFASSPTVASVVTYTDDSDRVRRFASTIITTKDAADVFSERVEAAIAVLPYSVTETTLGDRGIERINRSPLGQFSSIVPLLLPEKPDTVQGEGSTR